MRKGLQAARLCAASDASSAAGVDGRVRAPRCGAVQAAPHGGGQARQADGQQHLGEGHVKLSNNAWL